MGIAAVADNLEAEQQELFSIPIDRSRGILGLKAWNRPR